MFLQLSIQQTGSSSLLFHFSIVTLLLLPKLFLLLWQKLKWQKTSICKCETTLPFEEAESIKRYKVHRVCPIQAAKSFYIHKWISFAIFKFCHNRRNGFQSICFKCLRALYWITKNAKERPLLEKFYLNINSLLLNFWMGENCNYVY